jgi:hypothetical protein
MFRTTQDNKENSCFRACWFTNLVPNRHPFSYHIGIMDLAKIALKILEYMFVAGWAGSALVLLLTGIEDVETLLDRKDENAH